MNIIELAKEAGFDIEESPWGKILTCEPIELERFADLVRAEERKECISNCLIVEHSYKNAAMWNHAQGAEACAGYLEDTK